MSFGCRLLGGAHVRYPQNPLGEVILSRQTPSKKALISLILCALCALLLITAPAAAQTPPDATPAHTIERDYIAWGHDADGKPTSSWVRMFADGHAEVLATRPEVLVAHADKMWHFVQTHTPAKWLDCVCMMDAEDWDKALASGKCFTDGKLNALELQDLVSGKTVYKYSALPAGMATTEFATAEAAAGIAGNAGPRLFIITTDDMFACGAHGSIQNNFVSLDLATGAVAPLDLPAIQAALPDLRAKAAEKFTARGEDAGLEPPENPADRGGTLSLVHPVYPSPKASPAWRYQFTLDACYACGDGLWSSYSISEWIESDKTPPGLTALTPAPAAVHQAWSLAKTSGEERGWSEVTADPAAKAKLLEIFRKP